MARLHLPRLLLLVLFLGAHVPASHGSSLLPSAYDESMCSESFRCGGVDIRYPFYLSNATRATPDYTSYYSCGYTDLKIICQQGVEDTETPILPLDQHKYTVRNIFYENRTIVLGDAEAFSGGKCPTVSHNVSFGNEWLHYTDSLGELTFFFGCSPLPALEDHQINCTGLNPPAGSGDGVSFLFTSEEGNLSRRYELAEHCSQMIVVPVRGDLLTRSDQQLTLPREYGAVLKQGFELEWNQSTSGACYQCEQSGGRCSYSENKELLGCFCSGGNVGAQVCSGSSATTVSPSPSSSQKSSNLLKLVLPIMACLLILACIAFVRIWKYKGSKRRKKEMHKRLVLGYLNASNETSGENVEFSFFSFEDIAAATDNFSDSKQIGRGGFGKVYKGKLEGVKEIAIKRLSKDSGQGIAEFKNEIVLIAKLQHRNLVRLLGCCIHEDERLLVYEYLPNKSLDAFLFDATKQYVLDWPTRYEIIKGAARGLLYLHQDSRLTIIHRDLKASNILLDSEMTPKISDFGMARIFRRNLHHANTNRIVGTYGYMSPEYVMGGAFSVKSDTYSFGVLLLEIVSGLKISSPQLIMNFVSLTTYAWRLWEDGKAIELVDSSVIEKCPLHEVLRCIHVGLLCVQDRPDDRPLISSIIFMLNGGALLPAPKQPAYSSIPASEREQLRENMENSVNEVSITTLEGR